MTNIYNQSIVGLYDRINRYIFETMHSESAGLVAYSKADIDRQRQYTGDLQSKHEHITDQPDLDLPETHPKIYELRPSVAIVHVENPASNDLLRLYETLRDELLNTQSARKASGLVSFDSNRFTDNLDKINAEIDYIEKVQPIDLPESIPKEPLKGPGRKGV